MSVTPDEIQRRKAALRDEAHRRRQQQPEKDAISRTILTRLRALPAYHMAKTVLYYLDVRTEVRTRQAVAEALETDKTLVVPYCVDGELELFRLTCLDELETGSYRILEPRAVLRGLPETTVAVESIDLIVVPGVAFDRRGARLGHGQGYYDKLLEHVRPDTVLAALAFDCQIFDEIPVAEHDIFMDYVITESHVYLGDRRR